MRDILEAIKSFIIRFFDNLSTRRDDENEMQREWIMQLEKERQRNDEWVQYFRDYFNPKSSETTEPARAFKPILTNQVPWNVRRTMLEREDREKFRAVNSSGKSTEDLERELGIGEANANQVP